uniref:MAP3K7 C-terminal like n=1 Tax=Ornithorhynchus anatinus TaxID=9258 RepID=A0A6I8P1Z9_ORNAN
MSRRAREEVSRCEGGPGLPAGLSAISEEGGCGHGSALDRPGAAGGPEELDRSEESAASGAHMIPTARVAAHRPVRIAFSLNDAPDADPQGDAVPSAFPDLDQQLQPLPPCHGNKESMQVFRQHCRIADEYHEVNREIARLQERKKELLARLDRAEKENVDAAQLGREYAALSEENRALRRAQAQCVEQLEKLRLQYHKRQGSS